MDHVFLPFGYPVWLVVGQDRDPRFLSHYWEATLGAHGILPHPLTDSLSQAFVKNPKEVIGLVSSEDRWVKYLPRVEACINHASQSSLGLPASSSLFGYTPRLYRATLAIHMLR